MQSGVVSRKFRGLRCKELGEGFCLCYSNKLRSNWDCLIIDARVPGLRSLCSGTGTVIVESGASWKGRVSSFQSAVGCSSN